MNGILTCMALLALVFGLCSGRMEAVSAGLLRKCGEAVPLVVSMTGALCLWSGLMEIAERAGLIAKLTALFRPILGRMFPASRRDERTMGLISMNVTANLFGLGNAATPAGLAAMERMAAQSGRRTTREIVTFLVMNTCSLQLIPTTTAALRQAAGSAAPMEILPTVWISSAVSLAVSLGMVWICSRIFPDRRGTQ